MKNLITLILISLSITSCKFDIGTDVGNPAKPQNGLQEEPPPTNCGGSRCLPPQAGLIAGNSCHVLYTCTNGLNENEFMNNCFNQVYELTGLNSILSKGYDSYKSLDVAYQQHEISWNYANYNSCINSISDLTCNSDVLNYAFNVNTPNDFTRVHRLLYSNESCLNMFNKK